jgi:uncharacterized protein YkwD
MRRFFACAACLLLALGTPAHAGAAPAPRSQTPAPSSIATADYCAESEELAFLTLINNYRKQHGLGALAMSQTVGAAAEHHSRSMATADYFSHTLIPEGISWSQNMTNHGYAYNTYRGENIAAGNSGASATFTQWKNSPSHDANMLSPHYRVIGIGRVYNSGSTYKWYWTTDFGGHVDGAAKLCGGGSGSGTTTSPTASAASGTAYKIVRSGRTANSYSSTYAYDGQGSTAWTTYRASKPPAYAYVWFDLGGVKTLGAIQWQFLASGYADSMQIQVSSDRQTWRTLIKTGNAAARTWQSLATPGTTARYVRFYFANPNKDLRLGGLAEVRFVA